MPLWGDVDFQHVLGKKQTPTSSVVCPKSHLGELGCEPRSHDPSRRTRSPEPLALWIPALSSSCEQTELGLYCPGCPELRALEGDCPRPCACVAATHHQVATAARASQGGGRGSGERGLVCGPQGSGPRAAASTAHRAASCLPACLGTETTGRLLPLSRHWQG